MARLYRNMDVLFRVYFLSVYQLVLLLLLLLKEVISFGNVNRIIITMVVAAGQVWEEEGNGEDEFVNSKIFFKDEMTEEERYSFF